MYFKKRYRDVLLMVDTCQAATLYEDVFIINYYMYLVICTKCDYDE